MLSLSNPLAFYAIKFFCLLACFKPLIIALSYSKGHRLCFLAGDRDGDEHLLGINTCRREGREEELDKRRNWIAMQAQASIGQPPGRIWSEPCLSALAHVAPKCQTFVGLTHPVTRYGPSKPWSNRQWSVSLQLRQTLRQTEGANSWRLSPDHITSNWSSPSLR